MSALSERPANPVVGQAIPHEAAALHVTGEALYTDDLAVRTHGILHAHPVQAPHAHARVTRLDTAPALAVPGVVRVLTADDVPGVNDAGVKHDEPLFPSEVMFHGHAVCWVLGETLEAARLGSLAVEVDYEPLPSLVTVPEAIAAQSFQGGQPHMERGEVDAAFADAGHVFSGEFEFARSTSTSRRTAPSPSSTRTARCSCSRARSTPPRPRTSSRTCSACRATW